MSECPQCGRAIPSSMLPSMGIELCAPCLVRFAIERAPNSALGGSEKDTQSEELLGRTIGPYRLLQVIGEGGFGVVYSAEQCEPIHRKVALKVIKPGMDSNQVITRFRAEQRALASLDHPNVAQVFDAGLTPLGRLYFVMELIQGPSLLKYCDRRQLTVSERLRLFLPVCRAIAHAHQKGIIHRDLKPSNILVTEHDGLPVPKVIDFGVAKAIDRPSGVDLSITRERQLVGTPAYMSPEQTGGGTDLDVRVDVYALGVLLYQLLTGHTPLENGTTEDTPQEEWLRLIREHIPPRASTCLRKLAPGIQGEIASRRGTQPGVLIKEITGDLDWISRKAIEKDRDRRYPTPLHLAEEIERHLEHRPIEARPPSARYLVGTFVRRHRLGCGVAATFLLGTGTALAFILAGVREVQRKSEEAFKQAAKSEALMQSLLDVLFSGSAFEGFRADYTVREMLVGFKEKVQNHLTGHPDLEARVLTRVGELAMELGDYSNGFETLEGALTLAEEQFGKESKEWHKAASLLAAWIEDVTRGIVLGEEVLVVSKSIYGPDHWETVRSRVNLETYRWKDWNLHRRGDPEAVKRSLVEAARTCEAKGEAEYLHLVPIIYHTLVRIAIDEKDYLTAESFARKRLNITEAVGLEGMANAAFSKHLLGEALLGQGSFEQAERYFREAMALNAEFFGADSASVADDQLDLAKLYLAWDRLADAEVCAKRAEVIGRAMLDKNSRWLYRALQVLLDVYRKAKHPTEDLESVQRELDELAKDHPNSH